jgi:hypothetical protein
MAEIDHAPQYTLEVDLTIDVVKGNNGRPIVASVAQGGEPWWSL